MLDVKAISFGNILLKIEQILLKCTVSVFHDTTEKYKQTKTNLFIQKYCTDSHDNS